MSKADLASDSPEVVVEREPIHERTALSDDPVFAAYIPERDPLVVLDFGVELTKSNVQFAFFEPGEIGVLTVESAVKGDMARLLDTVCRHFGASQVVFINVIGAGLADVLHGFESTTRTFGGESMHCLEGEWRLDEDGAVGDG